MSIATIADTIIESGPLDPRAAPLLADLIHEYDSRYGTVFNAEGATAELHRYPPEAFAPAHGNFLLLVRGGETIAGGAFMRFDDATAEVKRVWTRSDVRRQGLAQRIMQALEDKAASQGYTRIYLTTGFRQPEAVALYLGLGYRPLFLPELDPALYKTLPFEKHIGALAGKTGTSALKVPSPELARELHAQLGLEAQPYGASLAS
jgi:GNAT superfamily N-acetyltransferase